ITTPVTLVKIIHVNVSAASGAAPSGAQDWGGSTAIVGACSTRAPASSRSCTTFCACGAARVTTIVRRSSGRVPSTRVTLATSHPQPGHGRRAPGEQRLGEASAQREALVRRPALGAAEYLSTVLARHERAHPQAGP